MAAPAGETLRVDRLVPGAPPMPGKDRLGAVIYEIDGRSLRVDIVEVPGLVPHWIEDVIDEVYPRRPEG